MIDAKDVGVKVVCLRAATIVVEIAFEVFPAPCPLRANILAVEQIAVNSIPRREFSELLDARLPC